MKFAELHLASVASKGDLDFRTLVRVGCWVRLGAVRVSSTVVYIGIIAIESTGSQGGEDLAGRSLEGLFKLLQQVRVGYTGAVREH